MHHARILEASGLASWKNRARTPDKNRVFCKVERHAAEIDTSRSGLTVKTHMFCKKIVCLFLSKKCDFTKTMCFTVVP